MKPDEHMGDPPEVEPARILVVDDEKVIREILCEFLALEGYVVTSVEDGESALGELKLHHYDLLITDLKMPGKSGIELLNAIEELKLNLITVVMTGFGTVETAIAAMKRGAYDYILKPFKVEEVVHIVERGLDKQRLQAENVRLREALSMYRVSEAIATSLDVNYVLDVILRAAIDESQADVATLHLQDPKTGRYEERIRMKREDETAIKASGLPSPDIDLLLGCFQRGENVLSHGDRAAKFFGSSSSKTLMSFTSLPLQVATRVIGMLNVFSFTPGKKFDEGVRKMLSILASRAAASLDNARLYDDLLDKNRELSVAHRSLEDNFEHTVSGFAQALEESDLYTRGHSERVALYAEMIARGLGLPENQVQTIVKAGLMHDIGKIGIRWDMLNKPGKLTPEEVKIFREHPEKGKRILSPIPCLRNLIDGAWCHHEWFNGGGYPRGLSKHDIPLMGRVVAIADAYDAMTSDRAYRKALRHDVAVAEIVRCAGSQFDPEISELFLARLMEHRKEADQASRQELVPP